MSVIDTLPPAPAVGLPAAPVIAPPPGPEHVPGTPVGTDDDDRPAAIDLDHHPRVRRFLADRGLGALITDRTTSPAGRNAVWIGPSDTGAELFVKQLLGPAEDVPRRMARLVSFQEFADAAFAADEQPGPRLLDVDREAGILVYESFPDAVPGARLVVDEEFTAELAHRVGVALASAHAADPVDGIDDQPLLFPSPTLLEALPSGMFDALSFGELQAWSLLQADPAIATAVRALLADEADAPRVPTHGDFRLDQVLVDGPRVLIADWEEFRLGDAARDVGAFAGEWLYRSVLDIVTTRGGQRPILSDLSHQDILRRGADNLQRLIPFVGHFWRGYREVRPELDPGFTRRATAHAGWHTIDRLLASSSRLSKITGIERAAAGIGRTALISPDRFISVLGLKEAS
ncbi:class IV lanthionine synthetase subunit LxmK [Nakamurella flavida]|uniref:Class IV lanthionine synthetase subunit LxmK n=1 Tax=Nakamurella flavida TaxID=363630 RepID=A0A939C5D1_9ACTN|nr:class V lanthionine synthetase subunit LxmK [Nakamurella flavida]MBM9476744.1 class IV lanthionine synthetase subunit LxmK [Nakamurella flavida]MDP9778818.1 hypothetical protein [Nakamurella flavida]